jgi:hypothetical protein
MDRQWPSGSQELVLVVVVVVVVVVVCCCLLKSCRHPSRGHWAVIGPNDAACVPRQAQGHPQVSGRDLPLGEDDDRQGRPLSLGAKMNRQWPSGSQELVLVVC